LATKKLRAKKNWETGRTVLSRQRGTSLSLPVSHTPREGREVVTLATKVTLLTKGTRAEAGFQEAITKYPAAADYRESSRRTVDGKRRCTRKVRARFVLASVAPGPKMPSDAQEGTAAAQLPRGDAGSCRRGHQQLVGRGRNQEEETSCKQNWDASAECPQHAMQCRRDHGFRARKHLSMRGKGDRPM